MRVMKLTKKLLDNVFFSDDIINQILENQKFCESIVVKLDKEGNIISIPIKEIKEKAEKWDKLITLTFDDVVYSLDDALEKIL